MKIIRTIVLAVSFTISFFLSSAILADNDDKQCKIGILAKRGVERCQEKWGPTADYLTENIPGYSFKINPLTFDKINEAVEKGEVDFILANPSFYVELEYLYGTSRMATLNDLRMGEGFAVYGGVIFCRADRRELRNLKDLKGKTFMAVEETSFGGWLTAWRELKEHGIDPHEDFASLSYGGTHDAVIYAVRDGKVDAGSVRTDVLEQMAEEGNIRLEDFYVFPHDHTHKFACEFPFVHSTETYPEWSLAKVKHTSEELAKEVTVALLEMSSDNPAAKAAQCAGWTIPQQYQSVRECLKYLRVGRYKDYGKVTFQDVLKEYWFQLICGFIIICLIVLFAFRVMRLNRKLKENEERTQLILNSVQTGIAIIDAETHNIIDINLVTVEMIGLPKENIVGKICHEFICPVERGQCPITDLGRAIDNSECVLIKSDGNSMPIIKTVIPVEIRGHKCLIESFMDITDRKRAEEVLKQSEKNYRDLFNNATDAIYIQDKEGRFLDVNQGAMDMYGYPKEFFLGKTPEFLSAPGKNDMKKIIGFVKDAFNGKPRQYDFWGIRKNGEVFPKIVRSQKGSYMSQEVIITFALDITERKQAEEALRESEERFKKLSNLTFEGILIHDKGVAVDINESLTRMFGYTREEMIGENVIELCVPQEYHATIKENIAKRCAKSYEVMAKKKDGTLFPIELEARNVKGKDEEFLVTAIRDITERKRDKEELRKSEERFRAIFETAEDSIFIKDCNFRYVQANPAMENLFSVSISEIIGKTDDELFGEEARAHIREVDTHVLDGEIMREEHTKPVNDVPVTFSVIKVPMRDTSGKIIGLCGIARDITEIKRLQTLESRAERLETAGTIAGQVAHDFNNLLGPIMAYPEFIHDELPHDHKAHAYLDAIEDAAKKIADINQDLLTMGRRGHYNQKVIDLNRVVLQAAQEMESRTKTVTMEMNLCEDLMKIKGGGAQIHRMLTNLLVNAEDAMQDIGQVTIKTENYYADDTSVAYGRVPKGEYVKLTISDTGCGIPDDIIQKILDPFFSTKTTDKKRGSGLGLSVVDAVMKDQDGYLDLSSKVGHGTSFYLYFPITREDAGEGESEQVPGGTETVLIIDDDEVQRDVSTRLLKKLGYKISAVESGEKAVEFLKENPQDLLVLDMVMPNGIDGAETYRQILEINPHQKAIILSGFSESDRVLDVQKLGAGAFIKKPVTKKAIAAAVRTELDREVRIAVH